MNDNLNQIRTSLNQIVKQEFLTHLNSQIGSHKQFLLELNKLIEEYNGLTINLAGENKFESIREVIKLKESILEKLNTRFQLDSEEPGITELESVVVGFHNLIDEAEEFKKEIQIKERFYYQQGDALYLQLLKLFKRFLFKLSVIPAKIKNVFRKKTTPAIEINYWNHTVPLRNLRSIYIKSPIYFHLFEYYRKTFFQLSASLLALKNYCEEAEKNYREKLSKLNDTAVETKNLEKIKSQSLEAIKSLENLTEEFNNRSDEVIEKIIADYSTAYLKAGTIELPTKKISAQKVIKTEKESAKIYNRIQKGWHNALFALADDWRMDYELYKTRYKLTLEFFKTSSFVSEKLTKNVTPSIYAIKKVLADTKDQIFANDVDSSRMSLILAETRNNLRKTLAEKLIPEAIDLLLKQEILNQVDDLEYSIEKSISELSDKRALVKTDLYEKEIKDSEISYISLRDMLSFSSLPKFKTFILKTKADQSLKIQKIQNYLLEVDQIYDFSLDSAQIMLEEKKGDLADTKKVVSNGLDRAIKKIEDIDNQLLNLINSFAQKTKEPLDQLNEDLLNLTFTESIFELRLKIAKDRALQKSREVRKEAVKKIKTALPRIFSFIKESYARFTALYYRTRKLIGLEKAITTIKGEVANFLSETGESINKLPFVYRRLFAVEPIGDERFFFGRDGELKKLGIAYNDWTAGKYSPTILFGEKGSGATSLINIFIKKYLVNEAMIRITLTETIHRKDNFLDLLATALGTDKKNDLQELIDYLNTKTSGKKIIILENLQHLFLRKINGFENLKLLFELMSESNENVFWITTCTAYGYRYLQKTITIADYFANAVELGDLTDKQIIDIVRKRHRVSGYDLYFEVSENTLSNKSFQKPTEEDQQAQLEKDYFSHLNKFADSNISLALLFWVRSTSDITEDKITIGHLPKVDFSFLSALSNLKIFVLDSLLIHDGLTAEDISSINRVSVDRNRRLLIALEDDGILVRHNKLYLINPLLYRPVVELLKSKNIIH